jgi:hypothetical protein
MIAGSVGVSLLFTHPPWMDIPMTISKTPLRISFAGGGTDIADHHRTGYGGSRFPDRHFHERRGIDPQGRVELFLKCMITLSVPRRS